MGGKFLGAGLVICGLATISCQSSSTSENQAEKFSVCLKCGARTLAQPLTAIAPLAAAPTLGASIQSVARLVASEQRLPLLEFQLPPQFSKQIPAQFEDTPYPIVLDYVRTVADVQIHVDGRRLKTDGVASDTTVWIDVHDASLEMVLDLITTQIDAKWYVRENIVVITTEAGLEDSFVTHVYNVRGLLWPAAPHAMRDAVPGTISANDLAELIQARVAPDSWDWVGGSASIDIVGDLAVVKQSPRVHLDIARLLSKLREADAESTTDSD